MEREARGRYWIGNYSIHQEGYRCWRVWWFSDPKNIRRNDGLKGEAYTTLREACAEIEKECRSPIGPKEDVA